MAKKLTVPSLLGLLALIAAQTTTKADYLLDTGDKISVSVFRQPNLASTDTVDIDGHIQLPLIGQVLVANHTVSDLVGQIAEAYKAKGFLRDPDVVVSLVQLRPFFIDGDVVKSGPHPYEGNLTVRRAVAIAGGYDLIRLKVDNPLLMAADLRSQYEGLWSDYARAQGKIANIQARLDGRTAIDLSSLKDIPIPQPLLQSITEAENEQFAKDLVLDDERKSHLERALSYAREEEQLLGQGQAQDSAAAHDQEAAVDRMRQLVNKGVTSLPRLEDEERQAATLKNRLTDTQARLAKAHGNAELARTELAQLPSNRRQALFKEVEVALIDRDKIKSQLSSVEQKLLYTTAINSQLANGSRMKPSISIYRKVDGQYTWIDANENTQVIPGDVVDVAFSKKQLMGVVN